MGFGRSPACDDPILPGPLLNAECGASVSQCMYMLTYMCAITSNNTIFREARKPILPPENLLPTYDFVVIGSGNAGAVVAGRLSEVPEWNVLLIEAGPDEPDAAFIPSNYMSYLGTDLDWKYRTQDEKYACLNKKGSCIWPRGKVMGGTTVHHGMAYHRGNKKDYEKWVRMGNTDWGWEKVHPYFKACEDNREIGRVGSKHHGEGGPLPVERFPWQPQFAWDILQAGRELNHGVTEDMTGDNITGFTIAQTISSKGVRVSSVGSYVRPHKNRSNLHVLYNTVATKVIFDKQKKAVAVEFVKDWQLIHVKIGKEVILSGGAVNSPQLLLLSGIGPKKHLDKLKIPVVHDLRGVGKNLHNHVSYGIRFTLNNIDNKKMDQTPPFKQYLEDASGPMSATGLAQVTAILASSLTAKDDPDMQFFFNGYIAGCRNIDTEETRYLDVIPVNLHARSRGTLKLETSNPFDHPYIHSNDLHHPDDIKILIEGTRIALDLVNAPVMKKYNLTVAHVKEPDCYPKYEYNTDEYWECAIRHDTRTENHQGGSCLMSPKRNKLAVVDQRFNVHGVKNIRVIDASSMPLMVSGNPSAAITMMAERGCDFIKEDYGQYEKMLIVNEEVKNSVQYKSRKKEV